MIYDKISCDVPYLHQYIDSLHKMFQWIDVKDELPKNGEFLCLINDKIFTSKVIESTIHLYHFDSEYVYLRYEQSFSGNGQVLTLKLTNPTWIKPKHFAEVTHWYPLPPNIKENK